MAPVTGAELAKLWKAGAVNLPYVATNYANAATSVHNTRSAESAAFAGRLGGIFVSWSTLRNYLQDHILVVSRDNLVKAGEALVSVTNTYAATDDQARVDLEAEILETRNGPLNERPVDTVPPAPRYGAPQTHP